MIDNYTEALELMHQIEAQVPIPVYPTDALVQMMKGRGVMLTPNQTLSIKRVLYLGDEGGIMCDITQPDARNALICSLTHVRISANHPLGEVMVAYQKRRVERLAQTAGTRKPVSLTVKPRKKRRR